MAHRQGLNDWGKPSEPPWILAANTDCFPLCPHTTETHQAVGDSIKRLGVPQLGVAQLHWSPPLGWQEEAYWAGLVEVYKQGRARWVGRRSQQSTTACVAPPLDALWRNRRTLGLSNCGPRKLRQAHRYITGEGAPLALNQVCPSSPTYHPQRSAWGLKPK